MTDAVNQPLAGDGMPHTSSTRLKSLSLRLSSQSRTSGSSSKSYRRRILPLTLGQITAQAAGRRPIAE
jgi:hypothetical protein